MRSASKADLLVNTDFFPPQKEEDGQELARGKILLHIPLVLDTKEVPPPGPPSGPIGSVQARLVPQKLF